MSVCTSADVFAVSQHKHKTEGSTQQKRTFWLWNQWLTCFEHHNTRKQRRTGVCRPYESPRCVFTVKPSKRSGLVESCHCCAINTALTLGDNVITWRSRRHVTAPPYRVNMWQGMKEVNGGTETSLWCWQTQNVTFCGPNARRRRLPQEIFIALCMYCLLSKMFSMMGKLFNEGFWKSCWCIWHGKFWRILRRRSKVFTFSKKLSFAWSHPELEVFQLFLLWGDS